MKRSDSTQNIAAALCAAQSQLGHAIKGNTNPAFRSKYADLTAYIDASREALAANGLALTQGISSDGQKVTVTTLLLHKSGEWLESELTLQAMKPDPQGIGSAASYGRRYSLAALLNMGADDDDGNAASSQRADESIARENIKRQIVREAAGHPDGKGDVAPPHELEAKKVNPAVVNAKLVAAGHEPDAKNDHPDKAKARGLFQEMKEFSKAAHTEAQKIAHDCGSDYTRMNLLLGVALREHMEGAGS